MNLFDKLVTEALQNHSDFSTLRVVVEKELLHHDILRELAQHNYLKDLTFIGGTCLRCCYGSNRLSEDLDFTGGNNFNSEGLANMGLLLQQKLHTKYGLVVKISEPKKEDGNVSTWKITIQTRPKQTNIPAQRINVDICSVKSYERKPMLLINPYGVDMGTNGLIIQAESKEEIFTDKLLAFALRPNRVKYRDLWDIIWLHQQNIKPKLNLLENKLADRNLNKTKFIEFYSSRANFLEQNEKWKIDFKSEMQRFLPAHTVNNLDLDQLCGFIVYLINAFKEQLMALNSE